MNIEQLKIELQHFTGSDQFYQNPLFRGYVYTEGVRHLVEKAGAYWLIDYVLSSQLLPSLKGQPFQVWIIKVEPNNHAVFTVEDGNDNQLATFKIEFTDFPIQEFTLWLVDNTLMLTTEY